MQPWQIIILVFSGLGVFNSLAFMVFLSFAKSNGGYRTIFLQIILLAFIFQITKAVLEFIELEFSPYIHNLYLIGIYSQGPAMYLFIRTTLNPNLKIWPKYFIIHFLPYIILSVLKYDFSDNGIKEWIVIYLVGIQSLAYVILCINPYLKARKLYLQKEKKYFVIFYLFPVFALLWTEFPLSGITKIDNHMMESILYPGFVYYLMFLKLKEPLFEKDKYKFSGIDEEKSQEIYKNLVVQITENTLYLDPDITLNILARKTKLQVNILSQVINQNTHSNFRDFINTFRIEDAKKQIFEKTQKGFTIASIAFDCGFNSLSAFNRAFKKVTGHTPSEYIKTHNN